MLPSHVLAANIPHWDDFSTVSALMWFLGAWRNISFPLKSRNLTRGCLHVRQSPSLFPGTQNFQADPCELNSVFSLFQGNPVLLYLRKKILVLFLGFSSSGSLIIFFLQRSNRFLTHWWFAFFISLLFLPYPYSTSTSKGEKRRSYLSLFPLSPVHNRYLVRNCRSNLHMTLSVRV